MKLFSKKKNSQDPVLGCEEPPKRVFVRYSQFGSLALLIFIWLLMYYISPHFRNKFNQINILRHASVLMVAAAGQTFAVIAGGLNIAIGATVAFSGMVSAAVAVKLGTAAGYIAGVLSGVGTGLILGIAAGVFKVDPTIGSVGLMAIANGLAFEITKGKPVTGMPRDYSVIGMGLWGKVPVIVVVALGTIAVVHLFLTYTTWEGISMQ